MDEHTEWAVKFDEYGGYDCMSAAYLIKDGETTIAELDLANFNSLVLYPGTLGDVKNPDPTVAAIAHMLAAAPKLYAALEHIVDWADQYCGDHELGSDDYEWIVKAHAALALARGEGNA